MTAGIGGIQGKPVDIGDGKLVTPAETGQRFANYPLQTFLSGEPVLPGADERVVCGTPGIQHILGQGVGTLPFRQEAFRIDQESHGTVTGVTLGFAAGRTLTVVRGDDEDTVGGTGDDGI